MEFVDARKMAAENPDTFQDVPEQELNTIRRGDYVKVCVPVQLSKGEFPHETQERFWVKVVRVKGDEIAGRIANDLVFREKHGLDFNDRVVFEKRHIYSVMRKDREIA